MESHKDNNLLGILYQYIMVKNPISSMVLYFNLNMSRIKHLDKFLKAWYNCYKIYAIFKINVLCIYSRCYSISSNVRPSVRFRRKWDFLGPYLR